MMILAVDTSSVVVSVAVMDNEQLIYEAYCHHDRNHSEVLMSLIEDALLKSEVHQKDLDLIAVSGGPGSFTGLRIGISTVKGLAQAIEKPVVSVPTLDALAWNIIGMDGLVCPIMDARRGQVYTCLYNRKGAEFNKLMPYSALPVTQLAEHLSGYKQPIIFVGDGLRVHRKRIKELMGDAAFFAPGYLACQRASAIAWLGRQEALAGNVLHYQELKPFYLRQSQAEQKRKQQTGI